MKQLTQRAMFGKNCKDNSTPLTEIGLEEIYDKVREGHDGLGEQTKILRKVRNMDVSRYSMMKVNLPFFTCSIFNPAFRGINNFNEAEGLIIDIDWKKPDFLPIELTLRSDPRIVFSYRSPGGEGLKLVFAFENTIKNVEDYIRCYKDLVHAFGKEYEILDAIDFKNSDVSRISFLCHDPEAKYNTDFIPIAFPETNSVIKALEIDLKDDGLNPGVYQKILAKLEMRPKIKKQELPEHLGVTYLLPVIKEAFLQYGLIIAGEQNLPYGIKIQVKVGIDMGEINIYYGRKGFSILSTPKKGMNHQLSELARHIVMSIIIEE